MHKCAVVSEVLLIALSMLAAGCSRSQSSRRTSRHEPPTAGNSQEYVLRLIYPKDYRQPERPTWMNETEWIKYSEGYMKGWQRVASRWKCRFFSNGGLDESGFFIDCGLDNSLYSRGWEDGQRAALDMAEDLWANTDMSGGHGGTVGVSP